MQDPDQKQERKNNPTSRPWLTLLIGMGVILIIQFGGRAMTSSIKGVFSRIEALQTPWSVAVFLFFVLALIIGLGGSALSAYVMRRSTKGWEQESNWRAQAVRRALPHLLPEPETTVSPKPSFGQSFAQRLRVLLIALIVVGASIGGVYGVLYLWPAAPAWVLLGIHWIFLGLAALWMWAKRRKKQAGENEPSPKAALWQFLRLLFLAVFLTLPLIVALPLIKQMHSPAREPFIFIVLPFGVCASSIIYMAAPFLWVLAALKRADYEGCIRRAHWVMQIHILRSGFMNLQGCALFFAGCYEEAMAVLQESISVARREGGGGESDSLDNIGCVLTAQGRYAEAVKMFEAAIEILPQQMGAFNDWAQVYLLQGLEPERVLELTERALKNYQALSFFMKWLERHQFASVKASQAWALARLNRHAEAAQALGEAFATADQSFIPEFAGVYYRAGQVEWLCRDRAKATEHWNQAQQLDPYGRYGRLAAEAMHRPPSFVG